MPSNDLLFFSPTLQTPVNSQWKSANRDTKELKLVNVWNICLQNDKLAADLCRGYQLLQNSP